MLQTIYKNVDGPTWESVHLPFKQDCIGSVGSNMGACMLLSQKGFHIVTVRSPRAQTLY